jgi:hypothetical protein
MVSGKFVNVCNNCFTSQTDTCGKCKVPLATPAKIRKEKKKALPRKAAAAAATVVAVLPTAAGRQRITGKTSHMMLLGTKTPSPKSNGKRLMRSW